MKKRIFEKKSCFKKIMKIKLRNGHSKEFCNGTRSPEKMSNCYSIITDCHGIKNCTKVVTSNQKKTLKRYFKKKNRQWRNSEIHDYLKNEIVN